MSFSNEWESTYKKGRHLSLWPWSDLVSFVHKYSNPSDGFKSMLELGCGAGANIPFFLKLDFDYHGVDGSESIINFLHSNFQQHKNKILCCDFTKELPFPELFDLVVDRSSLISNNMESLANGLRLLSSKLKPKGRFIAIDWFSEDHDGFKLGESIDKQTRNNFPNYSEFFGIGNIHFCNESYLKEILINANLNLIHLEHKVIKTHLVKKSKTKAVWNFVCEKNQ